MAIYFSAADLVKKSAAQIKYLRDKMVSIHTWKMEHGIEYQREIAEQKEESAEEFRTSRTDDNIVVFACHDIVCPDKLIEVKSIEFGSEQWYLESSLVQTAYYKSLVMTSDGSMFTPKFRIKEGFKREYKSVSPNIAYHLQFGEDDYVIEVQNPIKIINYFLEKAKATLGDYEDARVYDKLHKFKHFEELKDLFTYEKIN